MINFAFNINDASTISFVNNSATCTNCGQEFKEGYITSNPKQDNEIVYYCIPCAEIIDSLDVNLDPKSDHEYYMQMFNELNMQRDLDYARNNSYDWGALEAGKVSYSDYLRQQCGVTGYEEDEYGR